MLKETRPIIRPSSARLVGSPATANDAQDKMCSMLLHVNRNAEITVVYPGKNLILLIR